MDGSFSSLPPGADPSSQPVMEIGDNNVFEVDCIFESRKMGDQNVLEVKCESHEFEYLEQMSFITLFFLLLELCVCSSSCWTWLGNH